MDLEDDLCAEEVGHGRSGIVFKGRDEEGKVVATKVFTGEPVADAVNSILMGTPNPYIWNSDASQSTHYAREVLTDLVEYWLGPRLKVANSYGAGWNDEFGSFELHTEFIDGRPAALHNPISTEREGELSDLITSIMEPLQERLIESGFVGHAWQAGKGNPCATNNFLLEVGENNEKTWAWIDLESGLPPIFPFSRDFYSFYLPQAIKQRRPLFDDIDFEKLSAYLSDNDTELIKKLGPERYDALRYNVTQLQNHRQAWSSLNRKDRRLEYQLLNGDLSPGQVDLYYKNPLLRYARESARTLWKAYDSVFGEIPWRAMKKSEDITNNIIYADYKSKISAFKNFIFSEESRSETTRDYVQERIDLWEERKQLNPDEADHLRKQLESENTSPYLTDLFVHGELKVLDWTITLGAATSHLGGATDLTLSGIIGIGLGPFLRTSYTFGRIINDKFNPENKRNRNIALFTGWIPFGIGLAAYPVQMIYSGASQDKEIGKFMLYDIFSRLGEKIPIIGGKDSRTEHFFNHMPTWPGKISNYVKSYMKNLSITLLTGS